MTKIPAILSANITVSEAQKELNCPDANYVDNYRQQLEELFIVLHPELLGSALLPIQQEIFVEKRLKNSAKPGNFIYFPWSNVLMRVLAEDELNLLRTNRNQLLITRQQQNKLLAASLVILGLSIGSVVARTLIQSGIGKHLAIADADVFDLTNLNRVPENLTVIGQKKIDICANRLFESNPYLSIIEFPDGMTTDLFPSVFRVKPKPQVVIEETDDFKLKIAARRIAKYHQVPVVMVTCLGDAILVDVERFDLNPSQPIFHGLIPESELKKIELGEISEEEKKRLAVLLVGKKYIPKAAIASVHEIGKTLVGRPQLFSSVSMAAGVLTVIVRELILGHQLKSQRTLLPFSKSFLG